MCCLQELAEHLQLLLLLHLLLLCSERLSWTPLTWCPQMVEGH
jgi:hypothetical protein